jgi:glycosyltransferase involved in cell wall biosynthesis
VQLEFSIIIPTLNEEKLLPQLLKQINDYNILKLYDAELIISDGGSKDNTLKIARNFSSKVIIHDKPTRQNIASGRNEGARIAEGKILIFLTADIIFHDILDFFNFLKNKFVYSHYSALTCDVRIFPKEEILSDKLFHLFINNYFYLLNLSGIGMGRGECQVLRKEVFVKYNGYNEVLAAGEDFDLFRRIRKKEKIKYARELVVYESPRRYRKYGYLNVYKSWLFNSYYVIFKHKSMAQEWEEIR